MTAVVELVVSGPVAPWESIGLRFTDGVATVGGVGLRVTGDGPVPPVMVGWTLAGSPGTPASIDGLATTHVAEPPAPVDGVHPLGATAFDHVVVMTSSIERTCGEIERVTGEPLKRIREAGPVRQGFHRLGPLIVEVVESDRVTSDEASFWGFVLVVDDLHEVAGRLGPDVLSPPKAAVQPGRFIASFRAQVGLGVPVALMTPHVR